MESYYRILAIPLILLSLFSCNSTKESELSFRNSIFSDIEKDNWIKQEIESYSEKMKQRAIVLQKQDSTVFISFFANESDIYSCPPSFYSKLNDILILVYDNNLGYHDIKAGNYQNDFLLLYRELVTNDLLVEKMEDEVLVIEGQKTEFTKVVKPLHITTTYNPNILKVVYGSNNKYWSWEDDEFKDFNINCATIDFNEYHRLEN